MHLVDLRSYVLLRFTLFILFVYFKKNHNFMLNCRNVRGCFVCFLLYNSSDPKGQFDAFIMNNTIILYLYNDNSFVVLKKSCHGFRSAGGDKICQCYDYPDSLP